MAYTQPKLSATKPTQTQIVSAKAKSINNMSTEERLNLWKDVATNMLDPDQANKVSKEELIAFATAGNQQEQIERMNILANTATEIGKKTYKYNINQNGANELLYDMRNFHNFRGTREELISDPMFNSPIRPGTSPSKSYYMSAKDFLFSNEFDLNISDDFNSKPEIQSIVLNEFQPLNVTYMTTYATSLLTALEGENRTYSELHLILH